MKRKYLVESLFFFALVTFLPLLKVFLLGEFDSSEQSKYIRVYFWIQFLVPIIDFGYYWSVIRERVTNDVVVKHSNGFSVIGAVLVLVVAPVNFFYSQLLLLVTMTAWYNFKLQIFRIEGEVRSYYLMRSGKVFFDIVFVFSLYFLSELNVEMLLAAECISIAIVTVILGCKDGLKSNIYIFNCNRLFSFDYLYTLLKVARSNLVRLLIPFLFFGQGLEGILFAVLFYELIAQYISIEKLKDLLAGKVRVILCVVVYMFSLPIQYFAIDILAKIMLWDFGVLEIICVILGGSARIFSIYTLNVIKRNAFNVLVFLNIFLVIFGFIEIYSFQQFFEGESPAQLALLTFYSVEALIGLSLVVWLERSSYLKRM